MGAITKEIWIELPLYPVQKNNLEGKILHHFLTSLQVIEFLRPHHIRNAIDKVAQQTEHSAANIARILVENGLKAPKEAFPESFLGYVMEKRHIPTWQIGAATHAQSDLLRCWA